MNWNGDLYMPGVGRNSDFGKPEYDTNIDVENRLDVTQPMADNTLPREKRIAALMDRGMTRKEAEERIDHTMKDALEHANRKKDLLEEQTDLNKE